jgi:hypothetical protein
MTNWMLRLSFSLATSDTVSRSQGNGLKFIVHFHSRDIDKKERVSWVLNIIPKKMIESLSDRFFFLLFSYKYCVTVASNRREGKMTTVSRWRTLTLIMQMATLALKKNPHRP